MKNYLTAAAIINLIIGISSTSFFLIGDNNNVAGLVLSTFFITSGVLLLSYSNMDVEQLYKKKNIILAFGICLLPFNLISAIILLVATDKIKVQFNKYLREQNIQILDKENNNIKMKNEVNKENKKLDVLLKLGIAMVSVAGIMIATTSWSIITDFTKMILIAVIGVIFFGLSIFSDRKLQIKSTTITYWMLSFIAFSIAIFMLGYCKILGDWFSINGVGEDLFIAVLFLCMSIFSYATYKKFDIQAFVYISYIGVLLAITLVTRFMSHEVELSLLTLTAIATMINLLPKSETKGIKTIKLFGIVVSFILTAILIFLDMNVENEALLWITTIIQFGNLVYIIATNKNDEIRLLGSIGIIGIMAVTLNRIDWDIDEKYKLLINRSFIIVVTVIINFLLSKNTNLNKILLAVVLPFVLITILFKIDIVIAIYIGIVSLLMIAIGFVKKEYKALYIEGIIFLIANLIIQLWEFWGILPVWAYLLIGGLTLIGIVTGKELKKGSEQ